MKETPVLDVITTSEREYKGIIDYSTTKHYTFFDLSNNDNPNLSMMIIIWRMYYSHIRFSVYRTLYFGHYQIDEPILIPKKSVISYTSSKESFKPTKKISKLTIQSHESEQGSS